jgi:hypothetical protein
MVGVFYRKQLHCCLERKIILEGHSKNIVSDNKNKFFLHISIFFCTFAAVFCVHYVNVRN